MNIGDEIEAIFKQVPVYAFKLVNGDTILAKSADDMAKINEVGYVMVHDVMRVMTSLVSSERGGVKEVLLLTPWMSVAPINSELSIPVDTIITIAAAKMSVAQSYNQLVLGYIVEAAAAASGLENEEMPGSAEEPLPMIQPNLPEREPERLTGERMMEAEMTGEFDEEEFDAAAELDSASPPADTAYKKQGRTIH